MFQSFFFLAILASKELFSRGTHVSVTEQNSALKDMNTSMCKSCFFPLKCVTQRSNCGEKGQD